MKRNVLLLACLVFTGACADELTPPAGESHSGPPGSRVWSDGDLTCESSDDCDTGEVCVDNTCRIQRCSQEVYTSVPPIGKTMYFHVDRELMVSRAGPDAPRIEVYEPVGSTFGPDVVQRDG